MQKNRIRYILPLIVGLLFFSAAETVFAQSPGQKRNFRVEGGMARSIEARRAVGSEAYTPADSLLADSLGVTLWGLDSLRQAERIVPVALSRELGDTLASDSLDIPLFRLREIQQEYLVDSMRFREIAANIYFADSLQLSYWEAVEYRQQIYTDSLIAAGVILPPDTLAGLNKRKRKKIENEIRWSDPDFVRHNRFFKDSIGISKVTAISLVAPGYAQLYNSQYWKIPVLYGTVGTTTYFWLHEQKKYKSWKKQYDYHMWNYGNQGDMKLVQEIDINGNVRVSDLNTIQHNMIKRNTSRQLWMAAAFGSYIYFVGDGAVNYPGATTDIKKATTLSTIFPGAGQVYNGSYWKVPFVLGGFATMAMTIDWNNRGYQRFKLAYDQASTFPSGQSIEFLGRYTAEQLRKIKNSYRRNRDLCIILTGVVYALNIVDAHVDAHMKAYDISDDLGGNVTVSVNPVLLNTNTLMARSSNTLGMQLCITF
ncbi:MAG: DUF5683 domain-containing protein [Rikenellaceae bacterium]|nr:DUF5683 domain-containing protein [Rikenellaceae bacterium]